MDLVGIDDVIGAAERIGGYVHRTPVVRCRALDLPGTEIYFKAESFQKGGAFKARGATNAVLQLSEEERTRGVVCHSSGNHAQALASVAQALGVTAHIVMPECSPQVKLDATEHTYGAHVVRCANSQAAREAATQQLIDERHLTLVHPYDNRHVIAGAGTAALELLDEVPDLDAVYAPVGGGGLLSGTSIVCQSRAVACFGCEPELADDAARSFRTGQLVANTNVSTIADGLRTSLSPLTFEHIKARCTDIITVSDAEIAQAMRDLFERAKLVVEPSGAVSLAVARKHAATLQASSAASDCRKVGVIISGGNVDLSRLFEQYE